MMRRKLELWLALTFLILQVTSSGWCKWKCCESKKESIELNHQYINDPNALSFNNQLNNNPNELPLNNQPNNDPQKVQRNFCFNKISGSIRVSKLQIIFFN